MNIPVDPTLIEPVTIKVLILGDGRLRYDTDTEKKKDKYSLSLMIEGLHRSAGPIVRFSTTTAYRAAKTLIRKCDPNATFEDGVSDPDCDSQGEGSDIGDFQFGASLNDFDEIWIFGDQAEALDNANQPKVRTTQLTSAELWELQQFMNQGRGVFATGDHLSLGASMNAYVPRVRAMRTWRNGPATSGPTVNNTQKGIPGNPVGSELDPVPQQIIPVLYEGLPHPVLDGPSRIIEVLPDHPHEGQCRSDVEPPDLGDFPAGGIPFAVVVANSNRNQRPPSEVFPAISAYDGHLANVGRVLVDASFHHFVNLNLNAYLASATTGNAAYEDFKTYYHNIAVWLAPREKQKQIFMRALWEVRWRSCVNGLLVPSTGGIDASKINPERDASVISGLGKVARDALSRLTSPSLTLLCSIETINALAGDDSILFELYPWVRQRASELSLPRDATEDVVAHMIGGVMIAMAARFSERPKETISDLTTILEEIVRAGASLGLTAFGRA